MNFYFLDDNSLFEQIAWKCVYKIYILISVDENSDKYTFKILFCFKIIAIYLKQEELIVLLENYTAFIHENRSIYLLLKILLLAYFVVCSF